MQTLEDDEDRSRSPGLLPHRSANIIVIVVIVTLLGFDNQKQGWKTELLLEDTYDHLVVDHVDIGAVTLLCIQVGVRDQPIYSRPLILGRGHGRVEKPPEPVPGTCFGFPILSYGKGSHEIHDR